jgi:protein-disulfide isomerase
MSKRQEIRERRRKKQRQQSLMMVMIISGVALIVAALLMLPTIRGTLLPIDDFTRPELYRRPLTSGSTFGDPNAPVVIEEFSDFGCSHCATFSEGTARQIAEDYAASGKVYFIFRSTGDFLRNPLTSLAAEAAYCAADQDMFWEYHDLLFTNQYLLFANPNQSIDGYLVAFAESLELDTAQFGTCLDEHQHRAQVQQDEVDTREAGIKGTPSFLINGRLVRGALPYEDFKAYIEQLLVKAGN